MAKVVAAESSKRMSSFSGMISKLKKSRRGASNEKTSVAKNSIVQKLFHPDYILFDWEFFSRELEFE